VKQKADKYNTGDVQQHVSWQATAGWNHSVDLGICRPLSPTTNKNWQWCVQKMSVNESERDAMMMRF